jgi:HAD superfamily hydrolase (TIGR01509 family)
VDFPSEEIEMLTCRNLYLRRIRISGIKRVLSGREREDFFDMIRNVISDLGQVILLFDNQIFFRKLAGFCPFSAAEIARRVHFHKDLIRSFDTGRIGPEDFYREVIQRLDANLDQKTFFTIYSDIFSLNPPVLDVLAGLENRYRLVLLSNTDIERFGFIRKSFPEIFIFDGYVLSFEVGCMKPHPQIYKEALKIAKAQAEECVFIDDMEENIEGAKKVGMETVLYGLETNLKAELRNRGLSL